MRTHIRTEIKMHRESFYIHNLSESSKLAQDGVKMAVSKTRNGGSREDSVPLLKIYLLAALIQIFVSASQIRHKCLIHEPVTCHFWGEAAVCTLTNNILTQPAFAHIVDATDLYLKERTVLWKGVMILINRGGKGGWEKLSKLLQVM